MSRQVRILGRAWIDLDQITAHIAERSPQGAARLIDRFEEAMATLAKDPLRSPLAPEAEDIGEEIRQILFRTRAGRTCRALFLIVGDEVRVLRIRGAGQAPVTPEDLDG